jgi:hypothetical protein
MARTGRPRKGAKRPDSVTTTFRFPRTLIEALDEYAAVMRKRDRFAMEISRADAARELIVLGLKAAKAQEDTKS